MIILNEGNNNMNATCSRNKMLTGPVCYLFSWKHKLSQEVWRFVPYFLYFLYILIVMNIPIMIDRINIDLVE